MSKRIDLVGKTFGRLFVKEYAGQGVGRISLYKCKCSCGNELVVRSDRLKTGHTQSCGCLHQQIRSKLLTTHGLSRSKLYREWRNIINRTSYPNHESYPNYGGRGVTICAEWLDFQNFYDWAYANGYDENAPRGKCTLDRIDVNGNYEPSNCRWVTTKIQNNNKRNNICFEINGEKLTLAQLSEIYGFNYSTLYGRVKKGWNIEKALNTPAS